MQRWPCSGVDLALGHDGTDGEDQRHRGNFPRGTFQHGGIAFGSSSVANGDESFGPAWVTTQVGKRGVNSRRVGTAAPSTLGFWQEPGRAKEGGAEEIHGSQEEKWRMEGRKCEERTVAMHGRGP